MIISIHTHNNEIKIKTLMDSILVCPSLSNSIKIIVDCSSKPGVIGKNFHAYSSLAPKILYVNQDKWEKIRKKISEHKNLNKDFIGLLNSVNLNGKKRNTPEARNVSAVLTLLLSSKNSSYFKLDDDMVIYENFKLPKNTKNLIGLELEGCPDFSRLEWIELYKKLMLLIISGYEEETHYIDKFAKSWKIEEICSLISEYTNFDTRSLAKSMYPARFPQRFELSGGAYISKVTNLAKCMYPSWYEEDWFWFQVVRKINKIIFDKNSVFHKAGTKRILKQDELEKEEMGKILTLPLRRSKKVNIGTVEKYIDHRIDMVDKDLYSFNHIYKSKLPKNIKFQVKDITEHLESLKTFLKNIHPSKIVNEYDHFLEQNKIWQEQSEKLLGLFSLEELKTI